MSAPKGIRIAVCEDNAEDRDRIVQAVQAYCRDHEYVVAVEGFSHPDALLEVVAHVPFDAYLLDIMLPMISGLATAREIRLRDPTVPLAFITAHRAYALEAFELNAEGYLLKPWLPEAFRRLLDRIFIRLQAQTARTMLLEAKQGLYRVTIDQIEYVDVDSPNYLAVHLDRRERIVMRSTIGSFWKLLGPASRFLQLGRSLLINPDLVIAVTPKEAVMVSGTHVSLPRGADRQINAALSGK